MGSKYHVGGELYLPDPEACSLDPGHLAWARSVQPLLKALDARDLSKLSKTIDHLDDVFLKFAEMEVNLWAEHSHVVSKDLLVKVSGSLRSPLAHRANQPSKTTFGLFNAEVADDTNPCIAMIIGNTFQKGHTLLYDQILRRDEKSEGLQKYPEEVIQCHEAFVQSVRESSEAKVEIVHGALVKERIVRQQSLDLDILPLWGEYKGVSIVLDRESNYRNAERGHKYRRTIVFVVHPQRIFYASREESIMQDRLINVAAKIAKTNFVEGYYIDRKWKEVVPSNFTNLVKRKLFGTGFSDNQSEPLASSSSNSEGSLPLVTYKSKVADLSTAQKPVGRWDAHFSDGASGSITESRTIVAQALAEMDNYVGLHNWEGPADFPTIIQEWLGRQKETLFKGTPLGSTADIRTVYDQLGATTEGPLIGEPSLSDMILALMKQHAEFLEHLPTSAVDDLVYCSVKPDDVVEVAYNKCQQTLATDTLVRWSVNRPSHYVTRRTRCNLSVCQGKLRIAVPKNTDIPYTYGGRLDLQSSIARKSNESCRDALVKSQDRKQELPLKAASWCIHCKENTGLKSGQAAYVDRSPRWVLGTPSKYVERRPKCLTCQLNGRSGTGRFINPIYLCEKAVEIRQKMGNLAGRREAEVLECEPKGTRKPRLQKAKPQASK